jgi:aerobic carbon-monoxide dehydrogenase medium subunit
LKLYHPSTVDQAISLLAEYEDARCLAGGATLVAMMNADLIAPSALVSLDAIESLKGISVDSDGGAMIGAMTRHETIAEATDIDGGQKIVAHAARLIGHPAIRNMGTIGGSIAHADFAADYPAALVAAEAVVQVIGSAGQRDIKAPDFFVDFMETSLDPGEMVASICLPAGPAGAASAYEKFARVDGDFATVSVAVTLSETDGIVSHARLAVGACAPVPLWSADADDILIENNLSDDAIIAACDILIAVADPIDDFRGSGEYRLGLIPVLVRRAITSARAGGGDKA